MSRVLTHVRVCVAATLLLTACSYQEEPLAIPTPDGAQFETEVYPLLLRDCGFPECHGGEARFFRVYGPGRARLRTPGTELFALDPATPEEILESYGRARSMLRGVHGIDDSLLLRKPLDVSAGGAGHKGVDSWGRNVYARTDDPAYVVLWKWAHTVDPDASNAAQGGTE